MKLMQTLAKRALVLTALVVRKEWQQDRLKIIVSVCCNYLIQKHFDMQKYRTPDA